MDSGIFSLSKVVSNYLSTSRSFYILWRFPPALVPLVNSHVDQNSAAES